MIQEQWNTTKWLLNETEDTPNNFSLFETKKKAEIGTERINDIIFYQVHMVSRGPSLENDLRWALFEFWYGNKDDMTKKL